MAIVKIDSNQPGEIALLADSNLDLVRYFHSDNVTEVLQQSTIGAQIVPALVKINGQVDQVYAMVAVKTVDPGGTPIELHTADGDSLALSCLPFQQKEPIFFLKLVEEISPPV